MRQSTLLIRGRAGMPRFRIMLYGHPDITNKVEKDLKKQKQNKLFFFVFVSVLFRQGPQHRIRDIPSFKVTRTTLLSTDRWQIAPLYLTGIYLQNNIRAKQYFEAYMYV